MTTSTTTPLQRWKTFFADRSSVVSGIITLVVVVLTLISYTGFLQAVERRSGVVFVDSIHRILGPIDVTWPTFAVLYASLILALGVLLTRPEHLFRTLRAYSILVGIRVICMALLPLDPPMTTIPLHDPFVALFTSSEHSTLTKDLFFSGHTATLALLALSMPTRSLRIVFILSTTALATFTVLQHVHYTVDVIVAPMAALLAFVLNRGFAAENQ